jgi:hypothetical protein
MRGVERDGIKLDIGQGQSITCLHLLTIAGGKQQKHDGMKHAYGTAMVTVEPFQESKD